MTTITMKEHPILFSGPMVRAILEGKKTQTRRVCRDQGGEFWEYLKDNPVYPDKWKGKKGEPYTGWAVKHAKLSILLPRTCPYGQPGDRLWVRETWYIDDINLWKPIPKKEPDAFDRRSLYYRADGECCKQIPECACAEVGPPPWRPSIHMPRWISRITLEVKAVGVERLQEITIKDIEAEGFALGDPQYYGNSVRVRDKFSRGAFAEEWNALNAGRGFGWMTNPWVWVIGFRRIK